MTPFSPILVALTVVVMGCQSPPVGDPERPSGISVEVKGRDLRISGPYAHQNLAVYLVHSESRDDREFIALDEGLERGFVEVTEKEQEQVSELVIENRSDRPLFLQEGDRLVGGKQDRIIGLSMVVPPKSGKMAIPAFCIEQGRWSGSATSFGATPNRAFATLPVRLASKVAGDQHQVWAAVAEQKGVLAFDDVSNETTSLNEALDSEAMKKVSEEFREKLGGVFTEHTDAVGVAFALNGKIQEVDIYPGNDLLRKISPRLLQSYAIQAFSEKGEDVEHPSPSEVASFIEAGAKKSEETRRIDGGNALHLVTFDKKVSCDTVYEGKSVHLQWLAVE